MGHRRDTKRPRLQVSQLYATSFFFSSFKQDDGYLLTTKEKQQVGAPRLKVRRKLLEKVFAES
jgi:hypothetical protein